MSFQTGLSGLNAASRNLDVIGNNIANANTVGAKVSRAEFSEIVAASTIAATGKTEGIGVEVSTVSQLFSQGSVNVTGNQLDLAINGNGFFPITQTDGTPAYTRAGEFKLDRLGNIVTNAQAQPLSNVTRPQESRTSSGDPFTRRGGATRGAGSLLVRHPRRLQPHPVRLCMMAGF